MTLFHALILGIVEGFTEFLPVSSTFHLLFATKLMGMQHTEFSKFFDVFIQGAAIIPVLILFYKEWFQNKELLMKVAVSFIPTGLIGFLLHKVIKGVFFESDFLMLAIFILLGAGFWVLEYLVQQKKISLTKSLTEVTYTQAALIGFIQACAMLPGVSRAGAVMIGMTLMGYRRDEAAKYSFTLAVPTILAAAAYDALKMREIFTNVGSAERLQLVVGSVAAALSAFVIMKWFIQFLRTKTLHVFGWYRIIAGVALTLFLML